MTDFDNKYALYEFEDGDDGYIPSALETASRAVDEYIATLTPEHLAEILGNDGEEAFERAERRAVLFAAEIHGVDLERLGFSDTASRECFYSAIEALVVGDPPTATEIAETLINGNISTAREAIVRDRTTTEAVVFALDVLTALASIYGEGADDGTPDRFAYSHSLDKLRRCVNRG